jgi:hypothetical protein
MVVIKMDDWHGQPEELLNVLAPAKENRVIHIFWIYSFFHAVCIWGAIFFQKMHFIKIGFTIFSFIAVLALINYLFMGLFFGNEIQAAVPFGALVIQETAGQKLNIRLPDESDQFKIIAFLFIAVLMWVAGYLLLKEKQV